VAGGHPNKKVHVIPSSINAESGASNLPNDASEISMQILLEVGLDESAALFRAEYEMY